jgi:dCTP deaminase
MSLLSYTELCRLIDSGVIENATYDHVGSASIDLILGDTLLVERPGYRIIDLLDKNSDHFDKVVMGPEGFVVEPGQFLLAHTTNVFNLPNNISGHYMLKSTMARNGLQHLMAGFCDAGWNGSVLTLEFKNENQHSAIRLKPGLKCGQILLFSHEPVPEDKSYAKRGQYNGHKTVVAGLGIK